MLVLLMRGHTQAVTAVVPGTWRLRPGVPDVKCQEPVPTRAFPFRRMSGTGLHFTLGMSLNLSSGPLGVCSGAPIYRAALALEI